MAKRIASAKLDIDEATLVRVLASDSGPVGVLVKRVTAKAERYAKQRCPVLTGRARASITSRVESEPTGLVGYVGSDVEYFPYIEFGANGRPPAAPLRGGVEQALAEET